MVMDAWRGPAGIIGVRPEWNAVVYKHLPRATHSDLNINAIAEKRTNFRIGNLSCELSRHGSTGCGVPGGVLGKIRLLCWPCPGCCRQNRLLRYWFSIFLFFVVFQDGGSSIVLPTMKARCATGRLFHMADCLRYSERRRERNSLFLHGATPSHRARVQPKSPQRLLERAAPPPLASCTGTQ